MIILTTLFNAENFIERCLASIMTQSYKDFTCYITDDLSTDNSVNLVKEFIKNDERFVLIQNEEKLYQPGNYDMVLRNNDKINENDIVIEVDGDDWLPDSKVFDRIKKVYDDNNVWIANGSFKYPSGIKGFASEQIDFENLRTTRFTATHIRTWRVFLWRKINKGDLLDENGNYWRMTGDLSFMYPMLEMSGKEHYRFMPEINYIYNDTNPINDHKVDLSLVNEIALKIRNKPKYKKL